MLRPRQLALIALLVATAAAARPLPLQVDVCGKAAPKSTSGAPLPAMFLQVSKVRRPDMEGTAPLLSP
jgi:hypothetical protein